MKNLNWKNILLAVLTAAVAWLSEDKITGEPVPVPDVYGAGEERIIDEGDDGLYKVKAAFYQAEKVSVGNFTDGTTDDGIGVYELKVPSLDVSAIEAEFRDQYKMYPEAKLKGEPVVLKYPKEKRPAKPRKPEEEEAPEKRDGGETE